MKCRNITLELSTTTSSHLLPESHFIVILGPNLVKEIRSVKKEQNFLRKWYNVFVSYGTEGRVLLLKVPTIQPLP
jgi:hypothetical protein